MVLAAGPATPREPGRAPKLRRQGDMYSSSADASIDGYAPDPAFSETEGKLGFSFIGTTERRPRGG